MNRIHFTLCAAILCLVTLLATLDLALAGPEKGNGLTAPAAETHAESVSSPELARDFRQPIREAAVGPKITTDRAYFGAPPPIPHSVRSERTSRSCLECHALEERIEQRHHAIAPVPHREFSQCLQCHVKTDKTIPPFRPNSFVGLDLPGKGSRAHEKAPPTIPHKTFLREHCQSCHGPTGLARVRTPHPERSQCIQCHLPEASNNYDRPLDWKSLKGEL